MTWMWFSGAWNRLRASFREGPPARRRAGRRARLRVESLEPRIVPAFTDVWTGAVDTNWFNASNWSAGRVPNTDDSVEIPTGVAIVLGGDRSSAQANSVTVDGGILDVQGNLNTGSFFQVLGTAVIESTGWISAGAFSQTGGTVGLLGGTIQSSNLDLTGGVMEGFGTLQMGFETTGTVTNDGGILGVTGPLTIVGDYTQTAAGMLILAPISSSAPGSAPLFINGNATLDGVLGFDITTSAADTYPLIDYGSFTGSFATVGAVTPSGFSFGSLEYANPVSLGSGDFSFQGLELDAVVNVAPPAPTVTPSTPTTPTTPTLPDPLVITFLTRVANAATATPPASGTPSTTTSNNGSALVPALSYVANGSRLHSVGGSAPWELIAGVEDPSDPLDNKRHPIVVAPHGFEEFQVDGVLAEDLDQILRVQMRPFAVAFEHEILSGVSIVRALLTGTTPRTDLLAQESQVASVATLMMNTEVNLSTGAGAEPVDIDLDLPIFLIDPLQSYPAWEPPALPLPGPTSQAPLPSLETGERDWSWWSAMALIGAATGAFHFVDGSEPATGAIEPKRRKNRHGA